MQPSIFNLRVPLPARDEVFLMNTITDAQLVVSTDVAALLDREGAPRPDGRRPTDEELQALELLWDNGFLVDSRDADRRRLDAYLDGVKGNTQELNVTLLTTLQCNFACDYCFQGDHGDYNLRADRMSPETAARVAEWIERQMDAIHPERMVLTFFGGEPLLNLPVMYALAERAWHATTARGVRLYINIITNGLLLTSEVVDRMLPYGLNGIKVTLDGDRDAHNRMRPLRGGQGTFDRIIANIRRVAGKCRISIGGNFDESSVDSYPALLEFLREQDFADQLVKVNFKPIQRVDAAAGQGGHPADAGRRREAAERHLHDDRRRRPRLDLRELRFSRRQDDVSPRRDPPPRFHAARRRAQRPVPRAHGARAHDRARRFAVSLPGVHRAAGDVGRPHRRPRRRGARDDARAVHCGCLPGKNAATARSSRCVPGDAWRTRIHSLAT